MNAYVKEVLEKVKKRDASEPEFLQAVEEVFKSLEVVIDKHPEYQKMGLLERMTEPERTIVFRISWVDDSGQAQVNRGFRVQFNGSIGPYKGGLRFDPSVNMSIMKFLAFEQTLKNSLTGLPIGGGKGGADFDPRGRSDGEIMRFCQAYMTELYRHIGPDVDVPAGDVGVGAREVGYMYGQYKRIKAVWENGVLTGKGLTYGGSLIRPEATGYGATYYAAEMFKHEGVDMKGLTFALSGFGNVTWGSALKITELGGKVITISGRDGYVYDPDGVSTDEKIHYLTVMRASGRDVAIDYADKFGLPFHAGKKPWEVKADVVMPCATQNEINMDDAKQIVANGTKYVVEVSNMPCSNEAMDYFQKNGVILAPSKAVNAGGVATSCLEMSQNSMRLAWSAEEVDAKLKGIMKNIHDASAKAAKDYGLGYNLVAGANISGFKKIAEAMIAQGVI
ncbi:MAG: NADP-specific glutamate dehydrogenase [Oscillospiraceae bacterium]|nr:NADP-specific glutamate dehydrogenase [Oscillospiraceae bacterium]